MAFVGLHNHTDRSNFRLRDSTNKIGPLIEYAHSLGHKGIAITDHETISASLKAQEYVFKRKKEDKSWEDFKLLLGNEIYLCPEWVTPDYEGKLIFPHFILIALNERGHEQIRELSTIAWSQAFKRKNGMMRVPTYYKDLENIFGMDKGNVVAATACLGGSLPMKLLSMRSSDNPEEIWQQAYQWIDYMKWMFGTGYFFLEMQPSYSDEQIYVNQKLLELSKETDTPYYITTDSHYLNKSKKLAHKIYLSSQPGEREVDAFYDSTYVMSEEEIHEYMDKSLGKENVQKGIDNTMLVYDMVEDYDLERPLEIPYVPMNVDEPSPTLYSKWLSKIPIIEKFFHSKYPADRHLARDLLHVVDTDPQFQTDKTYEAMTICLQTILDSSEKMNVRWSAYLLQVADIVKLIWPHSIVGAGRGSGVGFILLDMLGITQINPLRETTKLYYWRFLNPERASVLDIDIDISGLHRNEVVQALKDYYGTDRISKVMTLSTEKSRSAILTACRGLNVDLETANYMSSLIRSDRGLARTLKQMYYGDEDFQPEPKFVEIMDAYPEVWEMAQEFEGLCCGVGSHAGGIIITDKPFTKVAALMRTNQGDIITQYDLHEAEKVSLIKFDLLSIEALDKIMVTLDLLIKDGVIKPEPTLKETYEKYVGIYTLERNDLNMWQMLWKREVVSFFQMEKESGIQAVALSKPKSVDDLATINSVMRLMPANKGDETPLQKYAKFSHDITLWYKEMDEYGLTQEEQEILKEIIGVSKGICEAQEYLVLLAQHPAIGGFSLGWGDRLRKAVAKKQPKAFLELEKEFFENAKNKHLSEKLVNYVWYVLIYTQRGYSFNKSHTVSYSLIGLQELNLCYKYPILYWNCANLVVASGSVEGTEGETTNYAKVAELIGSIQKTGTQIVPPDINKAEFSFVPNAKENKIIFSLKGMNGINDKIATEVIKRRPYTSMDDFCTKTADIVKNAAMIKFIKAGSFNELEGMTSREAMEKYLKTYQYTPMEKLTLSNAGKLLSLDKDNAIIPDRIRQILINKEFFAELIKHQPYKLVVDPGKKMVKKGYHDRLFKLNNFQQECFEKQFSEGSVIDIKNGCFIVSEKILEKELKDSLKEVSEWLNQPETIKLYNDKVFQGIWDKFASGTKEEWDMEALSCYPEKHALADLNEKLYGVCDFNDLPEEPEAYDDVGYTKMEAGHRVYRSIPRYDIVRLAGTVLDRNKDKHKITLLTTTGVVTVKFNKNVFSYYDRAIKASEEQEKEGSWFSRGSNIIVAGYRRGAEFRACIYKDTIYKQIVTKIESLNADGTINAQLERNIDE